MVDRERKSIRDRKLGAELQRLRKEKGLSLRDVANQLGIKPPHLVRVESGETAITEEPLTKLCKILGADPEDILTFRGQVSEDFADIIAENPEPFNDLRKLVKTNPNSIFRVIRVVRDGKW
ncbi:MAG: helix-turn-helix domain-containing protein [Rhizomicrobium sp.]